MIDQERKRSATEVLAIGVASGLSLTDAARQAAIKYITARRRADDPEFRQRVEKIRQAITDEALGRLTKNMTAAADTFTALLADPAPQVRLAAAKAILDYRSRLRADGELLAKVDRLENIIQELTNDPRISSRQDAVETTTSDRAETEGGEDELPEERAPGNDP